MLVAGDWRGGDLVGVIALDGPEDGVAEGEGDVGVVTAKAIDLGS